MSDQISENQLYTKLRRSWHIHPCRDRQCRLVVECIGLVDKMTVCEARTNDHLCHVCRGVVRPLWVAARDPVQCCFGNVKHVIYRNELLSYRLAGPGPWYMCRTCARPTAWSLGYNPTEMRKP